MAEDSTAADILTAAAQAQLKTIVDRLERIDIERQEATEAFNEVLKEAKSAGYCPKTLRKVVRALKVDRAKRAQDDAMLELYMGTIEGSDQSAEPAQRADTSLGIASITVTAGDGGTQVVMPGASAGGKGDVQVQNDHEALYNWAVRVVRRDGDPSISHVRKCLNLGTSAAESLLDRMEAEGIVSPPDRTGARAILQAEAA